MRRSLPGMPMLLPALAAVVLAVAALSPRAAATPEPVPSAAPYLDPALDFEARARDLVSRMTVEEKVSQLMNRAAAIPRLGVPEYEWWNECLHGVARAGVATVFPQAIGLAATFDAPLIHEMADVIGDEARAKHHQFVRQGKRGRYQGLTFWSPNINIFRDPRWGRGQETYGEDPFLAGRLGVAFVSGLQGDDPRYYKVIATAKHYAVHSGPEPDRHHFDARPSERDLWETYLPAFRDLVQEGKAASVMSAYNRVNGDSATASQRLLIDILRKQWGFEGYVVSDCGAVDDIFMRHKLVATAEEASALAVVRGCDLECGSSYRSLGKALERGLLKEDDLDVAVRRLMLARMRLGMFDPPERVKYAQIPYSVNDAPEHDRLARRVAQESIVLLKNDGVLPLRKDVGKIAVVGPNADDIMTLLGNYNGTPSRPVTILAGIRGAVSPGTRVVYERGVDLVEGRQDPRAASAIDPAHLRPAPGSSARGLAGAYFRGRELQGEPVLNRLDPRVDFRWDRGAPTDEPVARGEMDAARALEGDAFSVRWTGVLVPPVSGEYELVVTANDGVRLSVDGRTVLEEWTEASVARALTARIRLEAGREHALKLEYFEHQRDAEVRLGWKPPSRGTPFDAAVGAARDADVVVFVGGLTAEVEGEEMRVSYPGFAGGDRTDIELPAVQQRMLEALHATGKPVVLVLTTGSALAVRWAQEKLPAIVLAWYPGQQGGNAVADVLFGDHNPAGRLPVTFYASASQLPPFADYAMEGRTYRYFRGQPLYPFGHGLSYTRFEYSDLQLSPSRLGPGDPLKVSLDVKNVGGRDGDEVVQLYARDVESSRPVALRQLRGFERVSLKAGEQKRVRFTLQPERDLATYDETRKGLVVEPGEFEIEVGASSQDLRLRGRVSVEPAAPSAARIAELSEQWVDPVTDAPPGTTYHLFETASRGKGSQGSYLVYLPPSYEGETARRYPVLYWLHGGFGNARQGAWAVGHLKKGIEAGLMPETIVVLPQALPVGWYVNSKDGKRPVEDVVIKDLIPHVDGTYRTIPRRDARGIEGMSMGGYGALHLGMAHPALFGAISAVAPAILRRLTDEPRERTFDTFGDDQAYYDACHPWALAEASAATLRAGTAIRLLGGDQDSRLRTAIFEMHERLIALGVPHQASEVRGAGHAYEEILLGLGDEGISFWSRAFGPPR